MNAGEYLAGAQRLAPRVENLPQDTPVRPIVSVGVIGAGTMGGGIAMACANVGLQVSLVDLSSEALERGVNRLTGIYEASVARGRLDRSESHLRIARITPYTNSDALAPCDLIIEAVFEDLSLKQAIFRDIDRIAKPGALLATNTSGLDVNAIAAATRRPADVIGAHFFSPAHVMKLLEVVRADATSDEAVATLMAWAPKLGKVPVLSRVNEGFIGNALFRQYHREAHFMVEEGASPADIDAAQTGFGYAMGLFAVHDMAGNDVGYPTKKAQIALRPHDRRYTDLILDLCDAGRLGQKSEAGWYRYDSKAADPRKPLPDPWIEAWLARQRERMGVVPRAISSAEVVERCIFSMVNEAAKLLERGIAQRASDIDVAMVLGYGFPAARGGPLYYADSLGLDKVLAAIEALHQKHGFWWEPAPLLRQLVAQGRGLRTWGLAPND